MACDRWTEALSAVADGEDPGVDRRLLDAHVARCASCRAFAAQIAEMPDLSHRVTKLNAIADRARSWWLVRLALAALAVVITARAIPSLVLGHDAMGTSHAARHFGAYSVAYAVGLAVVVIRPARARTILPVAMVTAFALAVTAVIDASEGHIPLLTEATHLPELVSVLLVWLLARPSPVGAPAERMATPALRVVDEPMGDQRDVG